VATTTVSAHRVDLVLVRHAHAGSKGQWPGDDGRRPLSSEGRAQAARLAEAAASLQPSRIVTSPLLRCIETVQPLAERMHVRLEEEPALAPDAASEAASLVGELLVRRSACPPGQTPWVICTHGEILGVILPAIAHDHPLPHRPPGAKGSVWLVDATGSMPALRYIPRP